MITAASENGVAYGRLQFLVENNEFKNNDVYWCALSFDDGGTKTFMQDGSVFCYNVYDGGSDNGLWFDTENWNDRVEGNIFINFSGEDIINEASPGPNLVANNIISGMLNPADEGGIFNQSANQTWAVNNTIDSQSSPEGLSGVSFNGAQDANRGNRWEHPAGTEYDETGGYNYDTTNAYVNNVVVGCQTAVDADLPAYDPAGYPWLPDAVAGNYTDNPDDTYLTNEYGAQTYYPDGVQLLSLSDMGFVNEAAGDYRLTPGSPLNNAGVSSALYSNGPQGGAYTTTYGYNVMQLATQDFYGLLRDIPGDPQMPGRRGRA